MSARFLELKIILTQSDSEQHPAQRKMHMESMARRHASKTSIQMEHPQYSCDIVLNYQTVLAYILVGQNMFGQHFGI